MSDTTSIQADTVEVELDNRKTEAVGNAVLSYGTLQLQADRLIANDVTGQVEASGHLSLTYEGNNLEGDTIAYNLHKQTGKLTNARAAEQGVFIKGKRIEFSPQGLTAYEASFTTCNHTSPHYSFGAERITLTPQQTEQGRTTSGRLSLNRARITYHHRPLFSVPSYSVSVGQLKEPGGTPLPISGFSRDDGPYASISYPLGRPDDPMQAEFSYRYTTLRGIRGFFHLHRKSGPIEFVVGYTRREDISDREIGPDEIGYSLNNVLMNRSPEYGINVPDLPLGKFFRLRAELLRGSYSERLSHDAQTRARADRNSASVLLATKPYATVKGLKFSHAVGWRYSTYTPGDKLKITFFRHSLNYSPSEETRISLSHISRRSDGQTPFLFDEVGLSRELLADLRFRVNPAWRVQFQDVYDLKRREHRDLVIALVRTAHCLDYTIGWRKSRGAFFVGVGLSRMTGEM